MPTQKSRSPSDADGGERDIKGTAEEALARLRRHAPAAALAVVDRDQTLALTDTTEDDPVGLFEIGSVTKTFVGTTLAALVTDGVLALDDTLGSLLPEVGSRWAKTTLGQLATHSAGVPQGEPPPGAPQDDPFRDVDDDYVLAWLGDQEPLQVGRPRYSNFGYVLLGAAISRAAGRPLASLVQTEVLGPLKMGSTTLVAEVARDRLAPGHRLANGHLLPLSAALPAAGGIRSNAADMATWLRANLYADTTLLAPALQLAQRLHTVARGNRGWGLGWRRDGPVAWLPGGTGGFSCLCYLHLGRSRGYAWMLNVGIGTEAKATLRLARRGIPLAYRIWRTHHLLRDL